MTGEEFEEIMEGERYEAVTKEEIYDTSRWSTLYSIVLKKKEDETFWEVNWSRGSTEYQDNGPEDISMRQVFPKEVTVTIYE